MMKTMAVLSAAALALSACGGDAEEAAEPSAAASSAGALKVGMAFDTGGRGDGTFNDLAVAGLEKAKAEFGAETQELSPKEDGSDRADLLRQLADDGFNPVIGVGFSYQEPMDTVAKEYPEISFIRVDGPPGASENIAVASFAEHEGSYLVGAAAALKSKSNHIGFIGGNEGVLITKFFAGFQQGAKAVKPDVVVDDKRLAPGEDGAGFGNLDGAKVAAQAMYEGGADIVYTAAGGSWGGSFPAAAAAGKLAIGVDSDQYETVGDPALQKIILTSMVKRVDSAVYDSISSFKDSGSVSDKAYGLADDGVGYSTSGGMLDDIETQLEGFKKDIVDGKIKVSETPS
ncbi:MAG TPA: BMP family ABC transporter substrate-binding protein [Actinomycetales bacterium]